MEKTLGQHLKNLDERMEFLNANCDAVEQKTWRKPFRPEELQSRKEKLAEISVELAHMEAEKKAWQESWKASQKPLLEERSKAIEDIENKSKLVTEKCFKFVDPEERMTSYYDAEGILVESRPINAEEMQRTIAQANRYQMKVVGEE